MTATLELLTGQLLLQFFPISQIPGEDFEIFHVMPQVGHVLCGKSFIFESATVSDYERYKPRKDAHDLSQKLCHLLP